jgi:enoyl-CoA hydratase/carnithine racemase
MSEHIKLSQHDGVLEIIFARPDKKNALTNAMYRTAREALESAQKDNSIRVVLFGAEGNAFTAGNDLGDFANVSSGQAGEPQAGPFIQAIGRAEKPIVAAVPGIAVGVGTTMLLHCDLVYVADTAKLSAPFVNLALVPEAASSMLMPARIGYVRSFAAFALGESTVDRKRWLWDWPTKLCRWRRYCLRLAVQHRRWRRSPQVRSWQPKN